MGTNEDFKITETKDIWVEIQSAEGIMVGASVSNISYMSDENMANDQIDGDSEVLWFGEKNEDCFSLCDIEEATFNNHMNSWLVGGQHVAFLQRIGA